MPVYLLGKELAFPRPEEANEEGIVAVGGDVSPERLLVAYQNGIFPWPAKGYPLLWFSPDPRFALVPAEAHVSRSLRKAIRRGQLSVTADTAFGEVMAACARVPRPHQQGTWITNELQEGYLGLHELGYAHSIEAWRNDELVGGLYGVSLGRTFAGESMFASEPDASKIAFTTLLGHLAAWGFSTVDCQVYTEHLARFGATMWPRKRFLSEWRQATSEPSRLAPWKLTLTPEEALAELRQEM
ncbi:MAG: leucyl/phenylalanyl-tRNA--protein transferase [Myxococcales bacterium]|jgi:leucyl/phenylalanyl-tRNA--protein transferase|nr:leucyl/phenylalanyl-tRNA--protein transferase [Myxococcales bacterium]MDH3846103.1 leucyl/phenylalanyl-tRNA--protein transferase [Myxococcales bacterium]